jgi:hypothetical protein
MLRAPVVALGCGLPFSSLDVVVEPEGALVQLAFGARLGCGGTSDVYALRAAAGDRLAGAVAKVPRFATATVDAQFRCEAAALAALALDGADVPAVVCEASRAGTSPAHADACRWPVLLLAPAGEPLCSFVCRLVARERAALSGSGCAGAAAATAEECTLRVAAARRDLADRVAASVLRVLRFAHARGLIHCDVRPGNIVVVGGDGGGSGLRVLLVDWGLCVEAGTDVAGRGVPAYAPSALFSQASYAARPALDLAALAHTWLAVAHGSLDASAPWVAAALEPPAETLLRRSLWLDGHASEAAVVGSLFEGGGGGGGARTNDRYEWARGS